MRIKYTPVNIRLDITIKLYAPNRNHKLYFCHRIAIKKSEWSKSGNSEVSRKVVETNKIEFAANFSKDSFFQINKSERVNKEHRNSVKRQMSNIDDPKNKVNGIEDFSRG